MHLLFAFIFTVAFAFAVAFAFYGSRRKTGEQFGSCRLGGTSERFIDNIESLTPHAWFYRRPPKSMETNK